MNLSSVIKTCPAKPVENEILTTRPGLEELNQDEFCSLDSLWQNSNTEYTDAMSRLQAETEKAHKDSEEMLAKARSKVAEIEKEAYDKGFAAGHAEALKLGQEEGRVKSAKIEELLQLISQDRRQLYEKYQKDLLSLMQMMLERVLFHEVSVNPKIIQVCLKTALGYVVENSTVIVHLHANDLNRLKEIGFDDPELLAGVKQLEFTEDPAISEGGCLLETGFGEIDATLESRRDKLSKAIEATFMQALSASVNAP